MNNNNLKVIADNIISYKKGRISRLIDSKEELRWIPLIECWKPDKNMGISEMENWVVEEAAGLRILGKTESFLRVKILLEQPLIDILQQINIALNSYNINIEADMIFPCINIIRETFKNDSDYWITYAFKWYDELLFDKKRMLVDELLKITERKDVSQKLRHKALKEIKYIKSFDNKLKNS